MLYSIIVPVYNRPDEIRELLESLTKQTVKRFEVLIIDDGSENRCEQIVQDFSGKLDVRYFYKENSGQGFSRNFGFERAKGDYFVVFDSDCLIPPHYFETVSKYLKKNPVDCWGGPDKAHHTFSPIQKAINFSMTSLLTTGGIRGKKRHFGDFHPRSFNMGISREVFEETGGYRITRMGEDLEFSIRINKHGFKTALIEEAYVYHKRRSSLKQFFLQLHFFGRARINLKRFYPDHLKLLHFYPALFFLGLIASILFLLLQLPALKYLYLIYLFYAAILFIEAMMKEKRIKIAILAVLTSFTQLTAYAIGFITEMIKELKE